MLPLPQRIAFAVFALAMLALGTRGFVRLYRRIARGRADSDSRIDHPLRRAWYALRTTLLQERVFRRRRLLGVFHSFIFYAFVLYLLVNAVDLLDGYVDLQPLASPFLRALYGGLTDLFSVLAIAGVLVFVVRRWASPARRDFAFNGRTLLQPAVIRGRIARDSAIVSAFIVLHIGSRMVANAARLATGGAGSPDARWQPFGSLLAPLFAGPHAMAWRIAGYWGALGSVLLFLPYFPYSKHVHLLMAPLKYFFRRDVASGVLPPETLDLEAAELEVGAAKLADLSWPRLLDAYACIQCNRCQDVCPASRTGKALSPSALEINKRMVLNGIAGEVSAFAVTGASAFEAGASAGPALLEAVVSPEAVWACTTCGACVEVCPTGDEPMLDLIDIRRNLVMAEGAFPRELGAAFRGMERSSNPWGLAREKRMAWAEGLHVPTVDEVPDPDVLYWVGCAASYDAGAQKTARAVVQLLAEAGVSFAVLGKRECCTGDSARRAGNELLYQQMAGEAIAVLQEARPGTVLASCPHCVNTISTEYPQLGGHFHVRHHTEFLAELVDAGRLKPLAHEGAVAFHDPCYLGRHRGTFEPPRQLLHVLNTEVVELPRSRSNAFCCGAGGAQFWKEEEPGTERVADNRFAEAQRTLAASASPEKVLAVGCPFCKSMLGSTAAAGSDGAVVVKDVAELLWEGVQRSQPGRTPSPQAAAHPRKEVALPSPEAPTSPAGNSPIVTAPEAPSPAAPSVEPIQALVQTPATPSAMPESAAPKPIAPSLDSTAATEAVPRKKWAPGKSADPPPAAALAPAPDTAPVPAPSPSPSLPLAETTARRKWTPRQAPALTASPTAPTAELTSPEPPSETAAAAIAPETATTPAAPETSSDSLPSLQPAAPDNAGPLPGEPVPARKKWQPRRPT